MNEDYEVEMKKKGCVRRSHRQVSGEAKEKRGIRYHVGKSEWKEKRKSDARGVYCGRLSDLCGWFEYVDHAARPV